MKIGPYLSPSIKLNSRCIRDLNVRPDTLNLIEESVGNSLELIDTGEDVLKWTPLVQALRPTINKWNLMKLKFLYGKGHQHSDKVAEWDQIFTSNTF